MTIKSLKATAAKLLTAGLLAGAVVLAVPAKANAQEVVVFGGGPRYGYPVYPRYDRFRAEEFRRYEWRRDRFDHRFDRRFYR